MYNRLLEGSCHKLPSDLVDLCFFRAIDGRAVVITVVVLYISNVNKKYNRK